MAERRKAERFDVALPAYLSERNNAETKTPVHLITKDVSQSGAYFKTQDPLPVGTEVDLDLMLKVGDGSSAGAMQAWVKASGAVYRIDAEGMVVLFDEASKMLPFSAEISPLKS